MFDSWRKAYNSVWYGFKCLRGNIQDWIIKWGGQTDTKKGIKYLHYTETGKVDDTSRVS